MNKSKGLFSSNRLQSNRAKIGEYFVAYTAAFAIAALIVFYCFYSADLGFVRRGDGANQHYISLLYYSDYLKGLLGGTGAPLWDFQIGLGADVLTTLNYYVLGDPLNLLAVFFNHDTIHILYNALILLRLFLAGAAFSALCFYKKRPRAHTLVGAILYVFCGYALYAAVRHPFFVNPMIYLPLLILGLDKLMTQRKAKLFVAIVCLSAVSNYYFFFMLTVLTILYGIFRFFTLYQQNRLKNFALVFGKCALWYLVGVALSAVFFIPAILAFMGTSRLEASHMPQLLAYGKKYYLSFFSAFLSTKTIGSWTFMGFAPLALLGGGIVLFRKGRMSGPMRLGFVLLTLGLLLPIVGYVMNGMAYVSNRWEFGYSLLVAYMTVLAVPHLFRLDKKDWWIVGGLTAVYLLQLAMGSQRNVENYLACIALVSTLAVLLACQLWRRKKLPSPRAYGRWTSVIALVLVAIGVGANALGLYSKQGEGYASTFLKKGQELSDALGPEEKALSQIEEKGFFRLATDSDKKNRGMAAGYYGASVYFSIINSGVVDLSVDHQLPTLKSAYNFSGMDGRTVLNELAAVRYMTLTDQKNTTPPYGYKLIWEGEDVRLYQNQMALPLGFTYANYITREQFDALPQPQRQQALLSAVLLEEEAPGQTQVQNLPDHAAQLPYEITACEGVVLEEGKIHVLEEGGKIRFAFQGQPNSETYLHLENLHEANQKEKEVLVRSRAKTTRFSLQDSKSIYSFGFYDFYIHLGYSQDAQTWAELTFPSKGEYTFDQLSLWSESMVGYEEKIQGLGEDVLEDMVVENDVITGTLTLDTPKLLHLSIPYSTGWEATVNGEKRELLRANSLYMALPLEAGAYQIKLTYTTPGLKVGAAVTITTVLVLVAYEWFKKGRRKKSAGMDSDSCKK